MSLLESKVTGLGQVIGLATSHKSTGVTTAWANEDGFSVLIAGKVCPIHAQLAPLYDPKGCKMRERISR